MSSLAGPLSGIPAPADLWDASAATGLDGLGALVHRSNLLGADRSVANQGGGNTSAKGVVVDHAGREQRVLWVKGSGTDLATITGDGFAALRLDEVEPLRSREAMDDASMVDYLRRCALEPDQPRPSIETLLHAFVHAEHVDHTHPDAVIALTSTPNGRSLADEAFGDEAVWLDYQRPGFDMSKRIAELLDANPSARAVLLERHGLVTWGSTSEEAYRSTIEFVTRAAEAVDRAGAGRFGLGGRASAELGESECVALLAQTLPALRGSLLADAEGVVLEVDRSPAAVAFASSARASEVSQVGAPCPDHLINTKHRPLVVAFDPATDGPADLGAALRRGVDEYGAWYREYYARHVDDETRQFPIDPVGPRVTLIPGVGVVTSGLDAGKARTTRDLYHRAIVGRGRRRRARWIPVAQRGGGLRDRVLAARALQARTGAAAQRALRPHRRGHRRCQRDRPCDRARARLARRACRRRGCERRRRARRRRGAGRNARHAPRARRRGRRDQRGRRPGDDPPDGARVRGPGRPRRVGRARDERLGHRDHARRLGAELRRARPRLLPGRAGGVPRPRSSRAAAARSSSSARRTRWSQERTPPRTRPRRRLPCTSGAASPRRAARTGSASTR